MTNSLNALIDRTLREEIDRLVGRSPTGEYLHADAKAATVARLAAADVDELKIAAVDRRFQYHQNTESERARGGLQRGLPGDFAPPQGEFHFEGVGVPKARASQDHWLRWIQQKVDHISEAQSALQAQLAEFTAYAPYLSQGMTTQEAYERYRDDHPEFGADAAAAD